MRVAVEKKRFGIVQKTGWVFLCILFLLLLSSWNTGENLLYIVFSGVLSFLLLSHLFSRRLLDKLTVHRVAPQAIHCDECATVQLRVENHKRFFSALALRLLPTSLPDMQPGYIERIPTKHTATLTLQQPFSKRGVYPLGPVEIQSAFPFGLIRYRRRYLDESEITVYPRIVPMRPSVLEQASGCTVSARHPSADGDEFFGLRDYVPGDEIRHISWRISARLGKWIIREHARDHSRFILLIFDTIVTASDVSVDVSDFEKAVEWTASLAVALLERQYNVGLLSPTVHIENAEGPGQKKRILEALARIQPAAASDREAFKEQIATLLTTPVRLLYITPDPTLWGSIVALGCIRAFDPRQVMYD